MSDTLDAAELERVTGYRRPAEQLRELHRLGFHQARQSCMGHIILNWWHYIEVASAPQPADWTPQVSRPSAPVTATAARRAIALRRIPAWANEAAIDAVYIEAARLTAATGIPHHVDHEIPLQGKLVCGLHVETNLRAIPAADNIRKGNDFDPC